MRNVAMFLSIGVAAITAVLLPGIRAGVHAAEPRDLRPAPWTDANPATRAEARPGAPQSGAAARAEAHARRAEALQARGHRAEALAELEAAVREARADALPPALHASIAGALGQAYLLSGAPERAAPQLAQARALAQAAGAPRIEAAVENDLGLLYSATGDNAAAAHAFAAATRIALAASDRALAAQASVNAARVARRGGQWNDVSAAAIRAVELSDGLPPSREASFRLAAAGDLMRQAAAFARADRDALRVRSASVLARALESAEAIDDARARAYALGYSAELAADAGDLDRALGLNARAVFAAQASGVAETIFQWSWQTARFLDRAARADDALAAYRRALDALASVKSDVAADLWAARESFREELGAAYLGYTDLLLRRARRAPAGARADLAEARGVLERFKSVELEDYFRDDCVARYLARARPVEATAPATAVIYPVPLADRLELLVSVGTEIVQVTVPVGRDALRTEAQALRRLLEKRTTFQYLPHAQQLHDWVVKPIEPILRDARITTLVFVPDDPLRAIPLGALHDGRDFLVARYALATAPSLTLVEPRRLESPAGRMLATGLTESVQGFPALPFVGVELKELQSLGTRALLQDADFTAQALERELRERSYSVVHIASHAQFEADSRRSFLLTYDGRMTIDRLEGSMKLNRFRDDPIELLFLSACQTAAGDERAALGLAGVAVKAGARSALATLWHINDEASSVLVAEFYRNLGQPGVNKAEALRRAQAKLASDLRYRHPGYWSPFLVIGNWL